MMLLLDLVDKGAALIEVFGELLRNNRLNMPNIDDETIWILAKMRCMEDLAIRS